MGKEGTKAEKERRTENQIQAWGSTSWHVDVRNIRQTESRDRSSYVSTVRDLEKLWVQSKTLQVNPLLEYVQSS